MQDYKSLRVAVIICATLVNTQTHTHTYTHRERKNLNLFCREFKTNLHVLT